MDESTVQQNVQLEARRFNCTLMRNNSGAFKDETGRLVRYGLGNISKQHNDRVASSDLIGITKIKITPDMVGKEIGVFTAIEVKRSDWNVNKKFDDHENAQLNFINWVLSLGGFAGFVNSIDNVKNILK